MRRAINICGFFCASVIAVQTLVTVVFAQQDKLVGRWEGKVQSAQGERETNLVIKNEGGVYTGVMPGMRQGMEIQLKDFKIDGDKVTARADVEGPQGVIAINYSFTLTDAALKGQGALDFGGQAFTFDIDLKRVSSNPVAQGRQEQQRQRMDSPQPQQKQSIDYFTGQWSYKYIGRESALWPAPRECVVTLTKRADGKSAEGESVCKHDGGVSKDSLEIVFDEASKTLAFTEKLGSGVTLTSKGDWTSPISIRFTIDPVTAKGQKLRLRRAIAIVAAHSFTLTEELSEDDGPFTRLGSAVFSKAGAK